MTADRAFTLLEVLVSLSISMLLVALAWSGFTQLRAMAQRNTSAATMALNAGTLYRRIEQDVSATVPGVQMRLETTVLGAEYGGARAIRLIAMRELASTNPGENQDAVTGFAEHPQGAVWYCWEWRPPTVVEADAAAKLNRKAPGSLWHATSSASKRSHDFLVNRFKGDGTVQSGMPAWTTFRQQAAFRRSRLRVDLDDNDLRLTEGWAAGAANGQDRTDYATKPVRVDGDRIDLMRELGIAEPSVLSCTFGWIDHQGYVTRASAQGVAVTSPTGATVAAPGLPHWNGEIRIVDGLWRDGRSSGTADPSTTDPRSAPDEGDITLASGRRQDCNQARPAVVFVNLVLYDAQTGSELPFTFSMQAALEAPAWRNL